WATARCSVAPRRYTPPVREARRTAAALSAFHQGDRAARSRFERSHRLIRLRARVRRTRPARFEGPIAARLRPGQADLPLPLQLSHLQRGVRFAPGSLENL